MSDQDKRHDERRRQDPGYLERRKIYNSAAWRNARRFQLERSPLCERCREEGVIVAAAHVDHVLPLAAGGAPYDADNLASLCAGCHSQKTASERSGGPMPEHQGVCVHAHPRDPAHPWNADGAGCPQCGTGGSP